MGSGSGVLQAMFFWQLVRGITVGIAGTATLYVADQTGVPQSVMAAARGVGMILGPILASKTIGRLIWSGESQYGFGLVLSLKAICVWLVPRLNGAIGLCLAFGSIGAAMSVLDTFNIMLVGRLLKSSSGSALSKYDLCYGIGGMVAPFVAVWAHRHSWDLLATLDLCIAMVVVRRRACLGKPTDWKQKIRNPEGAEGGLASASEAKGVEQAAAVPSRVVKAGLAFTLISQIGSTSISAWGFAFVTKHHHFPEKWAALVPSSFYLASMLPRLINTWLARHILPSALVHISLVFVLLGAICFLMASMALDAEPQGSYRLLFAGITLLGAGYSSHYSFVLVSMTQHGELTPQQNGMFGSTVCMGITMGLWLAGFFHLARLEQSVSALLIAIWMAHIREFPICRKASDVN
ncbi:unnamed protein product [Effrenium voratum]|uniref:MFS transporter n=1 Tax=Effrenium voratum TaxID=2562239 RepID=A0AA36J944_9DINO|nr:unnamed protein product [Effrenium voratum]CAJ1400753.1 unnamed protein product [Effrenium voratum]CAJ1425284.1 unnamed protein product [Effrenium voratum]